ncbi:profilin [Vararia minispora EC-137]|uniref:Profilin n=1 Tax=Vararia minispora EC-137 TaxID=1314806 RepID=A0ACB8QCT1_9AGAM|nr:profilin [Vararia minispora EC-137]
MSWQTYVDSNLIGTGRVHRAAILGLAGGVWATSAGFTLSADEQKVILGGFLKPEMIQASGFRLEGQKYFTILAGERTIQGKKQANGAVLVKTKQAVLVAEYHAPTQAAEATPVVESLADYLISVGY